MRSTAITTWSFDVLIAPSVLTRQSLSLACAITHTIIIICSRYTQDAFYALFFVQNFPSLFFFFVFSFSDHSEKERERERERPEEKKSVCKLLKSFMNERIGAKKGKKLVIHTHSSFSLLLIVLSFSLAKKTYIYIYIYNCDRLVHVQVEPFYLFPGKTSCYVSWTDE